MSMLFKLLLRECLIKAIFTLVNTKAGIVDTAKLSGLIPKLDLNIYVLTVVEKSQKQKKKLTFSK